MLREGSLFELIARCVFGGLLNAHFGTLVVGVLGVQFVRVQIRFIAGW